MAKQFIDEWKAIGIFGNANIANTKDWLSVISSVNTTTGVFNATTNSCSLFNSL